VDVASRVVNLPVFSLSDPTVAPSIDPPLISVVVSTELLIVITPVESAIDADEELSLALIVVTSRIDVSTVVELTVALVRVVMMPEFDAIFPLKFVALIVVALTVVKVDAAFASIEPVHTSANLLLVLPRSGPSFVLGIMSLASKPDTVTSSLVSLPKVTLPLRALAPATVKPPAEMMFPLPVV